MTRRKASQLLADWAVSWISTFITSLQLCEDVLDTILSTNSGYVCRDLFPRWQYLHWDFSDVLRRATQMTENSASKSFRWLRGVPACPGSPADLPVSPDPLLLTRKDAWGHVGRKGGPRRTSEVIAHSRKEHSWGSPTQHSTTFKLTNHYKMNTTETIIISLSKPTATSVLKYLVLLWSLKHLKLNKEGQKGSLKVQSSFYMKTEWDFLT